jgi:hypothetical protein
MTLRPKIFWRNEPKAFAEPMAFELRRAQMLHDSMRRLELPNEFVRGSPWSGLTAHEDVDRRIPPLRPRVDGHMRFRDS